MKKGVTALVILFAASIPVIAQGADGIRDGAAHASAAWASMDADSNGALTRDEVASTPWVQRFDQMDADGDSKVTKKEF